MNKRIDELAHGCYEYIEGTLDGDIIEFDYKKFAELIVAECVDICNKGISTDTDWDNRYWNQACENRAYAIKQHFGV
jgi:hypothetical protein